MLKKEINSNKDNNVNAIYYDLEDVDRFSVGKIGEENDEYLYFHSIAPNGKYDGIQILSTENIYQMEKDTKYLVNLQKLMKFNYDNKKEILYDSETNIKGFCDFVLKNNYIIKISLFSGIDITGFILEVTDNKIKIKQLNIYGEYDGIAIVENNNIEKASVNSEDELILQSIIENENYII